MKLTNKTLTWLIAGMVSIALVTGASAQTAKERTGKVVRIKGAARYSIGNKVWQPLKVGTILKSGAVVQTAADSYADIVINENSSADVVSMPSASAAPSAAGASGGGSGGGVKSPEYDVIRVQNDSVVAIDRVSATDTGTDRVTETELDLRTGSLFFSVKKQAAASRFEIKYPNGVAGIRGTYGIIFADGRIICGGGSVVSASADSAGKTTTKVVPGGTQSGAGDGQPSPISSSAAAALQVISQETSYGSSGGGAPVFQRFEGLGREAVNEGRATVSPVDP